MKRDYRLDVCKGVAILLVMLGHCIVLNGLNASDPFLYDGIKTVQMPLFMLISGLLLGKSYIKLAALSAGDLSCLRKDIIDKSKRNALHYLLPFFSWFVVVYLFTYIRNGQLSPVSFGRELKELIFQTDKGLWFLTTLFVISLFVLWVQYISDLLCRIIGRDCSKDRNHKSENRKQIVKNEAVFLSLIFILYLLFFLQSRSGFSLLSPSLSVMYMPFFVFGYLIGKYQEVIFEGMKSVYAKVAVLLLWTLFIAMIILFDLNQPALSPGVLFLQMFASLIGSLAVFLLVMIISNPQKKNVLSFLGGYTLEIYVVHFRFARLLKLGEKGFTFYSPQGLLWVLLQFLLMSILTFVSIWIINRIKPLRFLLFGKR